MKFFVETENAYNSFTAPVPEFEVHLKGRCFWEPVMSYSYRPMFWKDSAGEINSVTSTNSEIISCHQSLLKI